MFPSGLRPRLKQSESEKVPVFEEPSMGYKKEDIPLFEDANKGVNEYREDDIEEDPFRGYGNNYLDHLEEEDEEMQGYGSSMVQEEVEYDEYREREEARAAALHNYYKQLRGHQSGCGKSKLINTSVFFSDSFYYPDQHGEEYYEQVDRGFGPQFQKSVDSLMNRVANQVSFIYDIFVKLSHGRYQVEYCLTLTSDQSEHSRRPKVIHRQCERIR